MRRVTLRLCALPGFEDAMMIDLNYKALIEVLSREEGGGYLATVSDLAGCMSDGATREEAALGRDIPVPSRHMLATA